MELCPPRFSIFRISVANRGPKYQPATRVGGYFKSNVNSFVSPAWTFAVSVVFWLLE